MDEDGDKDIVVAELDGGKVTLLTNDGSESFTKTEIDNQSRVRDVKAIDVDGDGDIDITATSDASAANEIIWYDNDGSENFTKTPVESSIGGANFLEVVDIDGDNDNDLIATSWR